MIQKQYQQLGSLFLASRKNAILGDEMGLGKTNQVVCALDMLELGETPVNRTLITCPAVVRPQWESQLASWLVFHDQHPVQQVEKTDTEITGKTVIVSYNLMNNENIFDQVKKVTWDASIYDEFHYMKNVDAQRTTNILGIDGIITSCKRNWFLSGTPVTARPADLFPVLCTIARRRLHPYTNWLGYIKHFCNAYKDEYGFWKHHGSSNLEELAKVLSGVMLRRLAIDVEPDLGKPLIDEVLLRLSDKDQEAYEDEVENIDSGEYGITQQRVILARMKGGVLHDHLNLLTTSNNKMVVFYHHKAIGRYLQARTERKSFKIDGDVSIKKRHAIVKEFTKAKFAILFAQSDAAGTGIDGLQHGCSVCYFAEMPWNPDIRDQNIKRLLRPGQKHKVKVIVPIVKDTVDERIYNMWFRKEKIIKTILKG